MALVAAETVRIEIPIETIDETLAGVQSAARNLENLRKAALKAGNSTDKARQSVTKFDKAQEKTQRGLAKWVKQKYAILLEAKERLTPVLSVLGIRLKNITSKTWKVTLRAFDLVTSPVRGIINLLKNPLFQAGAVLGVSIGLKDTIDTYKYFESTMSQVQAISGATGAEFDKLNAKAKEMGASTKFTAAETAEAFTYMGMAGWKPQEMLDGIEGILNLAAASGEELSATSDIITDALSAFHLTAADSGHFADVLAQASSNANTNVSMMGESFKYVASVAGAMKYSVEDVSLALGLMANSGVKSSMAGTALKTSLVNMAKPTDNMAAAMDKYGISLTDKAGKMKTLRGVMDNLRKSLGGLSEAEQTAAAGTIFGKEAMAGMLSIINASEKDYNKLAKAVNNADGASKKMADTMLDNLEGSITLFQSALDGVKLSLGERLAPYVRSIADGLAAAMPDVEKALDRLMDKADSKISQLKSRFREISLKDEWQEADFLGKVSIAWDEFVTQPFAEWWDGTGKAKIAGIAGDFGSLLGSGLHTGIMSLLGFDVSGTLDEGAAIGKSFAKGFTEGFDYKEISSKLWEGLGNIVKNAGKLLPGGEKADLSSLLSAALLAKMAKPVLSIGSGVAGTGRALFGAQEALGGISRFSKIMGSTGNAMVSGSGLLGKMAGAGYALSGTSKAGLYFGSTAGSMSGGTAAALGGASIAGGVLGAAGLVHGGMDIYKGFNTDDTEKADAYKKAGFIEVAGTGAGALAGAGLGATVGSAFFGIGAVPGALIGAGIGAVGSWFAGNKIKEDYEEKAKKTAEMQENADKVLKVTGQNIDGLKFKTESLNDAMHDSAVSAEEFSQMYQESVAKNLAGHFGDVSLSLSEIKQIAADKVFSKQADRLEKYSEAARKTESSLASLENRAGDMEKWNLKAGLGIKMDEASTDGYKNSIDSYIEDAKNYVENQHYQASVSVNLLVGSKSGKGITDGLDGMYTGFMDRIEKLGRKLSRKISKSLEDGVMDADEQKTVTKLQKKILNVTKKVSDAQDKASLNALKIKFGGSKIDYASFAEMQAELAADTKSTADSYYSALQDSLANLELMKPGMSKKQYRKEYNRLQEGYNQKTRRLNSRSENFQLGFIVDSYKDELDGILPDLKGSTQKKLKKAVSEALIIEPDVSKWEMPDMVEWFGVDKASGETREAVAGMLKAVAASVPDNAKEIMADAFKDTIPSAKEIMEKIDFTKFSMEDYNKVLGIENPQYLSSGGFDPSAGLLSGNEKDYRKQAKAIAERIHESLKENMDPEEVRGFIKEYMESAVSGIDTENSEKIKEAGSNTGNGILKSAEESITGGAGLLRDALENSVATASAAPFTPSVQINPDYIVKPYKFDPFLNGLGTAGKSTPSKETVPSKHAAGGYVGAPQLSWLAEEGYGEFVIPTAPGRRRRALELYRQAGNALGVSRHADGGFVIPGTGDAIPAGDAQEGRGVPVFAGKGSIAGRTAPQVNIEVRIEPQIEINASEGQSEENIAAVVARQVGKMADSVVSGIADQVRDAFSNMPAPLEGV